MLLRFHFRPCSLVIKSFNPEFLKVLRTAILLFCLSHDFNLTFIKRESLIYHTILVLIVLYSFLFQFLP